jgi:AhpD family alkylhydroperoxidase
MEHRIKDPDKIQKAMKPLFGFGAYLSKSKIEKKLINLIDFRVSQINGCAFCLDMHSKDLRAGGETEQRLYMLDAWREADLYSKRERVALAWAEAVTKIKDGNVPDEVYDEACSQFSEEELIDLTIATIAINSYNRMNIAFKTPSGNYQPGQYAVLAN